MRHYAYLSPEERDRIAGMHAAGKGVSDIARYTHRDKSTVSREPRRNGRHGRYGARKAQERACARHARCRPHRRLSDPALAEEVRSHIVDDHWSPEQIDGRPRLEHGGSCVVSFATIYRAVGSGMLDAPGAAPQDQMRRHLRRKGKGTRGGHEERRGKIKASHEISERPAEAGQHSRLGDWEDDTVVGRPGGPCLVTITDRRSRLLVGGRAASHTSAEVGEVEVAALAGCPLESVTPDRGKEFANHAEVSERLGGVQFYFCEPHHPWQKPTVENANGLIREFFPKGTDEEVRRVYGLINDRPRKVLGYRTANEVYQELLHSA